MFIYTPEALNGRSDFREPLPRCVEFVGFQAPN